MTDLIRRLLWWLSSAALTTVLLFLVLVLASDPQHSRMPLLLNLEPTSSSREAEAILGLAKAGQPGVEGRVERLGTIFAIYAIPRLGSLGVSAQARVLLALRPVRARTGDPGTQLGLSADDKDVEVDLLFWRRFTEERALDFRPPARARIVRRWLAGELSIRRRELYALDTYALPELVAQLGRVRTAEDVRRVHLLVPAISRLTDEPWHLPPHASPEQASRAVANIRRYWDSNGGRYRDPAPLQMVAEMLSQTEFAALLAQVGRGVFGIDPSESLHRAYLDLKGASPGLLAGFLGAFALGPLIAASLGLGRIARPRLSRSYWALPLGSVALLSFGLSQLGTLAHGVQIADCALFTAATVAFLLTEELNDRLDFRVLRVLERRHAKRRLVALLEAFLPTALTLLPVIVLEIAIVPVLSSWSADSPTIWQQIGANLARGELEYPMAISLVFGLAVSTLELVSNPLVGALGRGLEEFQ
jgi:hypothetical protein